jgi:hypothetical protein
MAKAAGLVGRKRVLEKRNWRKRLVNAFWRSPKTRELDGLRRGRVRLVAKARNSLLAVSTLDAKITKTSA